MAAMRTRSGCALPRVARVAVAVCIVLCFAAVSNAVDSSKFKTCSQSGFCRRHRSKTSEPTVSHFHTRSLSLSLFLTRSVRLSVLTHATPCHRCDNQLSLSTPPTLIGATLEGTVAGADVPLTLRADFYSSGAARIRLEEAGMAPRWTVRRAGPASVLQSLSLTAPLSNHSPTASSPTAHWTR